MKPHGTSSQKSTTNRKYGIGDLTTIGYGSQEAIVPEPMDAHAHARGNEGIRMETEFTYTVERTPSNGLTEQSANNHQLGGW